MLIEGLADGSLRLVRSRQNNRAPATTAWEMM